jgi:hypothetical protein
VRTLTLLLVAGGAHADEQLVALHVSQQAAEHHGHSTISLVVAPAPGMRLLDEGPLTLELTGESVRNLRRKDAVDPRAETPRFEVPLGKTETTLRAHLLAWVCKGERCRPVELTEEIPLSR